MIRFVEVKGMAHIGDLTFKIRNTTPTTFRIDIDTSKGLSVSGGMIVQVKQETIFQFVCLHNLVLKIIVTHLSEIFRGIS